MAAIDDLPLPRGWTKTVRSSVLHAISVAFAALTRTWASATISRRGTARLQAELDRANTEIALLNEELAIKNDRLDRMPPRRRPHYRATDRMRILQLKAARGWSGAQTAKVFLITEDTVASWLKRTDEEGDRALVQATEPVNKFPAFVGYLVRHLKTLCPTIGKKRIGQVLARAGLHLGTTTVGRMLRQRPDREAGEAALAVDGSVSVRATRAKRPNHIWHVDLTVVPSAAGFWVPWVPFSKIQRWPFCWWTAVAIDQFSRRVCGFALFLKMPTSRETCQFLDRVIKCAGAKPKHIITDKGRQFISARFKGWCRKQNIRPRYGAVGKQGSIAVIERFIRSMKTECCGHILVPFRLDSMREELACYVVWYNQHRPHQALAGLTPDEVYRSETSPGPGVQFEPRPRWPVETGRHGQCKRAGRLHLVVQFLEGRRHLPVVELTRAA